MLQHIKAGFAQILCILHHFQRRALALMHGIHIGGGGHIELTVFVHQQQQALNAHGKTDRGSRFAAQLFNQTVIAAAAAHRGLRTEFVGGPFEHGLIVVIQAAHQPRVFHIGDAQPVEHGFKLRIMRLRGFAEILGQARCSIANGLQLGIFAVEHAQRIGVQAAAAVIIQLRFIAAQIGHQSCTMRGTLFAVAQTVDFQSKLLADAQLAP